ITVTVNGDLKAESDETFFLNLANPTNAKLPVNMQQLTATIVDDDSGGTTYYINDASTVGDVYCTAPGSNANDGKTPATPLASLNALTTLYQGRFHAGDTVYIDTGAYQLFRNVVLDSSMSGVRFIGPGQRQVTPSLTADVILADKPVGYWRLGDPSGSAA